MCVHVCAAVCRACRPTGRACAHLQQPTPHHTTPVPPAGLHYDALAVAAFKGAPESMDATSIPSSGPRTDAAMEGARQLAALAHAARQFTDTATFTLR